MKHRIDWKLQGSAIRGLRRPRLPFWVRGSFGVPWEDEGRYWLYGLGIFTLSCWHGWDGRYWSIGFNQD